MAALCGVVTLLSASCTAAMPPPIDAGLAGSDGPCRVAARRSVHNPAQWTLETFVFEPTGDGSPFTGGTCSDASRPVILFGHGYPATFTEGYDSFLRHLVSNGFVVVYPGYQFEFDPVQQYRAEDGGFVAGVAATPRADTTRVGFVGHSWGAGMAPAMMQRAVARGWGAASMWSALFAPSFPYEVGTGPIELPSRTRMVIVSFEEDYFVDMRIAGDIADSVTLDPTHVSHLLVRSDYGASPPLPADHTTPVTLGTVTDTGLDVDHYDRWAVWRPIDAVAGCALSGRWCDTDLTDMGTRPDGHVVRRGELVGPGADVGPPALLECGGALSFLDPRGCG